MKNKDLINRIKLLGTLLLLILGSLTSVGCTEAGNAFARNLAATGVQQAVISGVRTEIEGTRGTTVNSYSQQSSSQNSASTRHYDGRLSGGGHYKGAISNTTNRPHGYGTLTLTNGVTYTGNFQDGNAHGQGTLTLPGGDTISGTFRDGETHGQIRYVALNGEFVGEYEKGVAINGTFTGKNGIVITGTFHGDRKGTITYSDGRVYVGQWDDGGCYEAPPKDGWWYYERPHGEGKMTHPDGNIEEGQWKHGEFLGEKKTAQKQSDNTQQVIVKVRCIECGTLNNETAKFCQECGAKMVMTENK